MFKTKRLYAKDSAGNIRVWSIGADDDGTITISHGVLGGIMQTQEQTIEDGLAGRTLEEQVHLMINSKIKSKMDTGYLFSKEEAMIQERVNALGLKRAMTCKAVKDVKEYPEVEMYWQFKYNGNRCMITKQRGEIIAYSRKGIQWTSIEEIIEEADAILEEGETLDGELYKHGVKLQTIGSWVKRRQEKTKTLEYHVYDFMSEDVFSKRFKTLRERVRGSLRGSRIKLAPTTKTTLNELDGALKDAVEDGYEGIILRLDTAPYEAGKRSKSAVKIKQFYDDEFLVVDITPSVEGHAVLHCVTEDGAKFKCSAPGDHIQREKTYVQKDKYIGRYIQIKYQEFSKDGKPIPPVAERWRNPSD